MKQKLLFVLAAGIAASQCAQAQWSLTGNAGTDTLTKFIGTTDNVPFKIKTNSAERMIVLTNGRIGMGTVNPQFNLDVTNSAGAVTMGVRSTTAGATVSMDRGLATANAAFAYKSLTATIWNTGLIGNDNYTIRNVAGLSNVIVCTPANNVGIGTNAPTQRLDVNGNANIVGNLVATGTLTAAGGNSTNWNTAFSWGNHAVAGYLTAETDPQVGVNSTNYVSKWDGLALVTSNIFSNGTFAGINTTSTVGSAQFVVGNTNASYGGMYINSSGAAGTRKPFYGYSLSGSTPCWTYYDEATSNFNVYNGGDRLTVDAAGQVGIGTTAPSYYLDILAAAGYRALNAVSNYVGSIGQIVNFQRTSPPSSQNDILQITVPAGSPDDFQFIECDINNSNRFQVNGDGSVGIGISTSSTSRLNVDGSNASNKKLYGIYANTDSASSSSRAIFGEQLNTTADAVGVYGKATGAPGNGYGVYGEGAYRGVNGFANATTYTGTAYGVLGSATGSTAGTRIGVYGSASGGSTSEANWGGYFPTKVYTSQIRVGTTGGATGYIACIGGKLIAEEVRVELEASWPDYVFNNDYQLMSLNDVEQHIKDFNRLPGIPSACEMEDNGIMLGQMQTKTMEKVEENTLYIIQLNKKIEAQNQVIQNLVKEIDALKNK